MTAKKRKNHIRHLKLLADHLERWRAEAESIGRTNAATMTVSQLSALQWVLDVVERHTWMTLKSDPPKGVSIIVMSDVAGAQIAVRSGDEYLCGCGCAEPIAGRIVAWMEVLPRHVPEDES